MTVCLYIEICVGCVSSHFFILDEANTTTMFSEQSRTTMKINIIWILTVFLYLIGNYQGHF